METINYIDQRLFPHMRPRLSSTTRRVLASYCLPLCVFKARWLAPLLFIPLLTAYVMYSTLELTKQLSVTPNAWDIAVGVLNGKLWIHHGLTNLFVYLISSLALHGETGQLILLKAGSRWVWFQAHVISIFIAVISYLLLLTASIFGVAAFTPSWTLNWSSAAAGLVEQQGLQAESSLMLSPISTVAFMAILLGCTWIGIGITVTIVTTSTRSAVHGFVTGLALNYSALLIELADLRFPLLDQLWFHQRMFLWGNKTALSMPSYHFIASLLYWIVWIVIGLAAFWAVCRKTDILAKESS